MKKYIKCDSYMDYNSIEDAINSIIKNAEEKMNQEEKYSTMWFYYSGRKDGCMDSLLAVTETMKNNFLYEKKSR